MNESRFYVCEKCGNTVGMIDDKGVPLTCCGKPMTHLKPSKRMLNVDRKENVIRVTASRDDSWVYLATDRGGQRKMLDPNGSRELSFSLKDEEPRAVYVYDGNKGLSVAEIY